jgi:DNA invertase Pin-like site-specific DNA recombinase
MTEGMVTIMAVFAQIEKKRLVKKLRAARYRKSLKGGGGSKVARAIVKSIRDSCGRPSDSSTAIAKNDFASRYFFETSGDGLRH